MNVDTAVDPRHIRVADVYKAERRAASLSRTEAGVVFAYDSQYLAAGGPPVATSLPLSANPVVTVAGAIPAFFAGLLPEGRRLGALRQRLKASLDDELSLLLGVGDDTAGDVIVVPEGQPPRHAEPTVTWNGDGATINFREVAERSGLIERRAIAGVQPKASAAMITLPAVDRGHEAIVKLNPPEYPHLVENEAYFLSAARSAGLAVPRFELVHDDEGEPALFVQRFDRQDEQRLAMEDGAQVLNIYPAAKYSVTAEETSRALIGQCPAARVAARDLFRLWLFAWLTGNGDMHAKNVAIVKGAGEWRVSPAYDLPSSLPYGDDSMALTIGGRVSDLSRKAFLQFAAATGLPERSANTAIDDMVTATEPVVRDWTIATAGFMRMRQQECVEQLRYRRRLLNSP